MLVYLKWYILFKIFFVSYLLSFVHYYYMLVYLKWYILFKFFLYLFFILCTLLLYADNLKMILIFKFFYLFFISYLLYTSIIYYKFKNDTYFLKIFLCKLSCNLYNGLFSGIIAIKNFLNYLHYVIFVTLHKQGLSFLLLFYVVFNTV